MSHRTRAGAVLVSTATLVAAPSLAADDPAVLKDLTAVIALQGRAGGRVVPATKRGNNDYVVACKDGSRYGVFVNAGGRVVVQKQGAAAGSRPPLAVEPAVLNGFSAVLGRQGVGFGQV